MEKNKTYVMPADKIEFMKDSIEKLKADNKEAYQDGEFDGYNFKREGRYQAFQEVLQWLNETLQPSALPPLPEPILDDNDLKAWEESKLTEKQVAERKEAVEWYRNPMKELTPDEQGVLNKTSERLFQRDGKVGAVWVKASERLPGWAKFVEWRYENKVSAGKDTVLGIAKRGIEYFQLLEWLDESATTDYQQVKESDAVEFAEWMEINRWEIDHREERTHTPAELYLIFRKEATP